MKLHSLNNGMSRLGIRISMNLKHMWKKACLKKLYTVRFHLCDKMEQAKVQRQ